MRTLFSLLLFLAPALACLAQHTATVNISFELHAPNLPDSAQVYITGNAPQLGDWSPNKVKMERNGPNKWQKQITVQSTAHLEYKYTLGSWQREATDSTGRPLPNFSAEATTNQVRQDQVSYWRNGETIPVKGGITGSVIYHRSVGNGQNLPARDLIVWLPPGYEQHTKRRYPVLYMHDGQNIFDPVTSSFGLDWRIDETADSLIRAGAMEPVIIVGIYNNADRMQEYIPGDKGNAYMDFVMNTVKPLIDKTYRTKPESKYTATGGSSAGGTISFMLAWEHPEVFSKAICMSPAFKIQKIDYVDDVLSYKGPRKKLYLYIDNGGIELEAQLQPGIDEMLQALRNKCQDYVFVKDPNAKHSETAWAKRTPRALKLVFPVKK
ncbi:alpha/beta hydrolase-fold protein [Pontibacter oryzae]|uniref:Histidine kinase n=1 Tax=Pontibacter oryzae TaxID=2304593 RepID=A0A399S4C0_9BACT|nr:alpha/beta hydrolase-fold protein [Pontibacter oryzae]RIJ36737.1 histidine kinase [Pontibacter oryzae]